MLCVKPINVDGVIRQCGQCINCRINKQREWTGRILLESHMYPVSSFVTLTYAPEHEHRIPHPTAKNLTQSNLCPEDLTGFLNRYRKKGAFRYYAVGEYGEHSGRAHYHLILFGEDPLQSEDRVHKSWGLGHTSTYELNPARAAYVAQYVNKKLNSNNSQLLGRYPEKARMSKGIGAPALRILEDICYTESGCYLISQLCDVPNSFRLDGRVWPIGKYLRSKLRSRLDIPNDTRERNELFGVPLKDFYQLPREVQQDQMEWEGFRGESAFFENHPEHDLNNKSTRNKTYVKAKVQTGQLPQILKTATFLEKKRRARKKIHQSGSVKI